MIRHILADGRRLDSIEGLVVPISISAAYQLLIKVIKEGGSRHDDNGQHTGRKDTTYTEEA